MDELGEAKISFSALVLLNLLRLAAGPSSFFFGGSSSARMRG
jgi:hypothetical protein